VQASFVAALIGACAWLVTCPVRAETVVDGRAIADERQRANWLSYGRTYAEHHYSPLTGINAGNVRQLGLAWFVDLPGQRSLGATPLAVDGVLYFSGTYGKTFAVDARRGQTLWEFDPDLAHHAPRHGHAEVRRSECRRYARDLHVCTPRRAPGRSLRQQVEQPGVASDRSAGLSLNWSTHP
jgi:glucose dehydrogenase